MHTHQASRGATRNTLCKQTDMDSNQWHKMLSILLFQTSNYKDSWQEQVFHLAIKIPNSQQSGSKGHGLILQLGKPPQRTDPLTLPGVF